MLISLSHRFIFVATLKTASTAIEAALRPHAEIAIQRSEWGKHLTLAEIERRFAWVFEIIPRQDFLVFAVMRDPAEFALSLYNSHTDAKFADDPTRYTGGMSFEEFLRDWGALQPEQLSPQSRRLRSANGCIGVDYLIDYADLDRQFAEVTATIGLPPVKLPVANVSPRSADRSAIDTSCSARLQSLFDDDFAVMREHAGAWRAARPRRSAEPGDVAMITWFHSFALPDGRQITGRRPISRLEAEADLVFAEPVAGKSVIDIGAWDGYFSFEAERRGARDVHATDHFCWSGPGWGTKAGFDHMHRLLGSKVRSTDIDVFDLTPERVGTYDIVLFLGVLYHLKNPLGGLEIVSALTREYAVIETAVGALNVAEPVMRFYPGAELNNDASNFWAPNMPCLENMLREVGFKRIDFAAVDPFTPGMVRNRVIARAWK